MPLPGSSTNRGWEPGEDRTVVRTEREDFYKKKSLSPSGYEIGREEKPSKGTARSNTGEKDTSFTSFSGEEEDTEIVFHHMGPTTDPSPPAPPGSPDLSAEAQYGAVLDMVQKLNSELGLITLDSDRIRTLCEKLLQDNRDRDCAMCNLTGLVKSLERPSEHLTQPVAYKPHHIIRPDLIDGMETSGPQTSASHGKAQKHSYMGVRVVGSDVADSLRDLDRLRLHRTNR